VAIIYLVINNYVAHSAPYPSIYMAWEKNIPFIPEFIIFYQSMLLILFVIFMLPRARSELYTFVYRLLFIYAISYMFFLTFPLEFAFEKPELHEGAFIDFLFLLLNENDLPYNQCPSLHISSFVVYWFAVRAYLTNIYLKTSVALWFLLVMSSVLFVYQHHFLDIPAGVAVGLVAVWLFKDRVK